VDQGAYYGWSAIVGLKFSGAHIAERPAKPSFRQKMNIAGLCGLISSHKASELFRQKLRRSFTVLRATFQLSPKSIRVSVSPPCAAYSRSTRGCRSRAPQDGGDAADDQPKEPEDRPCSQRWSHGATADMDNFTWSSGSFSPLPSWPGLSGAYDQVLRDARARSPLRRSRRFSQSIISSSTQCTLEASCLSVSFAPLQSAKGLGSGITHLDNADANSSSAMLSTATVVQLAVTFAMGRVVGS
jgi:hypothetical protein